MAEELAENGLLIRSTRMLLHVWQARFGSAETLAASWDVGSRVTKKTRSHPWIPRKTDGATSYRSRSMWACQRTRGLVAIGDLPKRVEPGMTRFDHDSTGMDCIGLATLRHKHSRTRSANVTVVCSLYDSSRADRISFCVPFVSKEDGVARSKGDGIAKLQRECMKYQWTCLDSCRATSNPFPDLVGSTFVGTGQH